MQHIFFFIESNSCSYSCLYFMLNLLQLFWDRNLFCCDNLICCKNFWSKLVMVTRYLHVQKRFINVSIYFVLEDKVTRNVSNHCAFRSLQKVRWVFASASNSMVCSYSSYTYTLCNGQSNNITKDITKCVFSCVPVCSKVVDLKSYPPIAKQRPEGCRSLKASLCFPAFKRSHKIIILVCL